MSTQPKPFEEQHPVLKSFPVRISHPVHPFSFPPHYHKEIEVLYINEGVINVDVNHKTYKLRAGDLLIIGSHHIHSYNTHEDALTSDRYLLIFDWHYLDQLNKNPSSFDFLTPVLLETHLLKKEALTPEISELFSNLYKEYKSNLIGKELMVTSELYRFLTLASRTLTDIHGTLSKDTKQLLRAHAMIQTINSLIYDQYHREITLSEAAESAGYSQYHFTRLFKAQTGLTFKAYLTNFRINMVKESLINDQRPITEIALSHGFNSIKSFNRNFKSVTGLSPSIYKKKAIFD